MDVTINRLNPNVPDPVESRRRAAGRLVRIAYATVVFGVVGFFVIYFGAPFVFLRGPGTVTSTRYVVSLPYTVEVSQMSLVPGATVKADEEIGAVFSPEQDSIVATYMRALADIAGRTAELRIKARVAQDSLEASRSYQLVTQEAVERLGAMTTATVTFRMEVLREYASARKAVVSQEAEVAESAIQLASLDQFIQQIRGRLDEVEQHFGKGRVFAPIAGIVSTGLAHVGSSLVAGTPIAEILDPTDIFVDWYIPNERLIDPKVGHEVFVLFGNRRIPGEIAEILPVSGVYAGTQQQQLLMRDRPATQIARVRFAPDAVPPPLNSTVYVHMHYTKFSAWVANVLVRVFGLYWTLGRGHRAVCQKMQVEADQSVCPACGAEGLQIFPVLHHMMCAYIGPQYDFAAAAAGYVCPKCRLEIVSGDPACEIVGTSARCVRCSKEMMVSVSP